MSVADAPLPTTAGRPVSPTPGPAAGPPTGFPAGASSAWPTPPVPRAEVSPSAPWSRPGWSSADGRPAALRQDGLSTRAGHRIATAFALAWILCPAIEPLPTGPESHYPLWQLPIDLATVVSIVAAVVVLWRGGRYGPLLGVSAGVMMAVMTMVCPLAGHTPVGWWTWAQTGLSLAVLGTSVVLTDRQARAAAAR